MNTEIADTVSSRAFHVTVALEADATPEQAQRQVDMLCGAIKRSEITLKHARILLGRMMAAVKERKLYRPAYQRFVDFTAAMCHKHRLSPATVGRALQFVQAVPDMDPEEAEKMPFESMTLLAQLASKAEPRQLAILRKEAPKVATIELRGKAITMGLLRPQGRPSNSEARRGPVILKMQVTPALRRRYAAERNGESDVKFLARLLDMLSSKDAKAA